MGEDMNKLETAFLILNKKYIVYLTFRWVEVIKLPKKIMFPNCMLYLTSNKIHKIAKKCIKVISYS